MHDINSKKCSVGLFGLGRFPFTEEVTGSNPVPSTQRSIGEVAIIPACHAGVEGSEPS